MGLSNLGSFHTIIGIAAIIAAVVSYLKYGKIDLSVSSGKVYLYGTLITSLTALGLSKHGGFNAGHVFSIFIVFLVLVAWYLNLRKKENTTARYFENFCLSFSLFLSLVPTVNETFTRIPIGHPLAKDIKDPAIANTLLVLLILFIAGSVIQIRTQKKINKSISF
jgi:cbb3-type cytochrome oxidase subunit 3